MNRMTKVTARCECGETRDAIERAAKALWGLYHPRAKWEDQTREQQNVMCEKAEIVLAAGSAEFDVEDGRTWALDGGQVYAIACEVRQDALAGKQRSVAEVVAELMRMGWRLDRYRITDQGRRAAESAHERADALARMKASQR